MTDHRLLTVRQPWAKPIVDGVKDRENRSSGFGTSYRGPLWIHAAAAWSDRGLASDLIHRHYPEALADGFRNAGFVLGAVLGRVDVVDAHHAYPGCCPSPWAEATYLDASRELRTDLVHLVFANPRPMPPGFENLIVPGALGLWRADRVDGLAEELDLALEAGFEDLIDRLDERWPDPEDEEVAPC